MPVDHIRYDLLTQDALRGVIRTVLTDVAVKGLPGDHHFFITFDTRADGVRMSPRLATNYPGEMTIVLQHQFWDLTVGEDDFEVGLAFNGIPERLHIPLKAVRAFMDPSVQFGLQFAVDVEAASEAHADEPAHPPVKPKPVPPQRPSPARQPAAKPPKQSKKESQPQAAVTNATPPVPLPTAGKEASTGETGEVVRLDRFRKK